MRRRPLRCALATLVIAGCASGPRPDGGAPYFPLVPGARWEYEVESGDGRSTLVVEAIGERMVPGWPAPIFVMLETRTDPGPFEQTSPVGYLVDAPYLARMAGLGYDRDGEIQLLGQDRPTRILPLEPRAGDRWSQTTRVFATAQREVGTQHWEAQVHRCDTLEAPAGTFRDVIEVHSTLRGPDGEVRARFIDHYAPGVGLVASSVHDPAFEDGPVLSQRLVRHSVPR